MGVPMYLNRIQMASITSSIKTSRLNPSLTSNVHIINIILN